MKFLPLLLLLCISSANGRQTEIWDTILTARFNKWETLVFKRNLDDQGRVISYVWERQSNTRDRRIPGIYTADIHCFFMARAQQVDADLDPNVTSVKESPTSFDISFKFDANSESDVSLLTISAKVSNDVTTVQFQGSGPIYKEFTDYINQCRSEAIDLPPGGDFTWSYKEEP